MSSSNLNPDSLNKFYKPYHSDDESDSDTYSDKDSYTSSSSTSTKSSISIKAPESDAAKHQAVFGTKGAFVSEVSGNYITVPKTGGVVTFNQNNPEFKTTKVSTTVMLNSRDRDTDVYPYPSNFTIRLPRIYRNVVSLNITQIKMLSAFYYFSDTKNNINLRIYEGGRTRGDVSNNIDVYIRNGTYTVDELIIELNNQLNFTPLYNRISYPDFKTQFIKSGDYTLLFNAPGDTTYNNITGLFDGLATTDDIVARYFFTGTNYGATHFTSNEILAAYYFPLLKDLTILHTSVATPVISSPYLQTVSKVVIKSKKTYLPINYHLTDSDTQTLLEGSTYYDRIVFGFQGLSDPYIYKILFDPANLAILDSFKADNTWDSFLVNKYVCSYDSTAGRFSIYSHQLNTSIVNTLNAKYTNYFTTALVENGISPSAIVTTTTTATNLNSALIDMYNFIQQQFVNYFGINFGTYSSTFFSNLQNNIFLYDAAGRYGWNLAYSGIQPKDSNIDLYSDSPNYWKNLPISTKLIILPTLTNRELYLPNPSGGDDVQYTFANNVVTDASGFLFLAGSSEYNYGYQDIPVSINPTSYFMTSFKSFCRQTLYIETLPPAQGASEQYLLDPANTPLIVNRNGEYYIDSTASDFNFYDISQNMMDGADFMRAIDLSGNSNYLKFASELSPSVDTNLNAGSISILPYQAHVFFKFNHGGYPIPISTSTNTSFTSDIFIEQENGQPFGVSMDIYWYRDRSAFMADVTNTLANVNSYNSKHYFIKQTISATETSHVITTDFVSYENSYLIINSAVPITNVPLRVFAIRNKPYGVYNIITDPNDVILRKMPVDLIYLAKKSNPTSLFPYDFNSLLDSPTFRNAYDSSGVSNNLLNNIIITIDSTHYDPYSFSNTITVSDTALNYPFKYLSPASLPLSGTNSWSQFFYNGSKNTITDSKGAIYYDSSVASKEGATGLTNEYIFANWFCAGLRTNLFNGSTIRPVQYPEQTIMPRNANPSSFSTFSYSNSTFSPFALCSVKEAPIITDISYNRVLLVDGNITDIYSNQQIHFTDTITNIMAIPFLPPSSLEVLPSKVIIKFAYTQPVKNNYGLLTRSSTLKLLNNDKYVYSSFSSQVAASGSSNDLNLWDDRFISNRQNLVLGVFYTKDILGANISNIKLSDALSTLTLKKIVQTAQWSSNYSSGQNSTKVRSPEWGTYYVYEKKDVSSNLWLPHDSLEVDGTLKTSWSVINKGADISNFIYMKHASADIDASSYYADIDNNSLCFVPFYPDPSGNLWNVGSFTGLTYTARPYLPFSESTTHSINPYIYFKPAAYVESLCVEDLSGAGLATGLQSTYFGVCGPFCYGLSGSTVRKINNATRPTFFNIRVNIVINTISGKRISKNPLLDLSPNLSTCYLDTQLFLYDTTNPVSNNFNLNIAQMDIINGWGAEKASNFNSYDDDNGYNYLSFINKYNAQANSSTNINIRSYAPTTKIKSNLRIVGKNWTDFGQLSLATLCSEIIDLLDNGVSINPDGTISNENYRIKKRYTENYTRALLDFNSKFIGVFRFGVGFTNASYIGYPVSSVSGFPDFITQYIKISNTVKQTVTGINSAQTSALSLIRQYITNNYSGVLPDVVIKRNKFTDPIAFSILFKSALSPTYANLFDQWGLGWNLGFDKIDTVLATRHNATTFIRIIDDFIYLKLNDEFNINSIDVSNKEKLSKTRDTSGQSNSYFGKLLLNTFGSYSQTFVQATKAFPTPLGKMDKLSFNFVDSNNSRILNTDCEFTIVMEISEMLDALDVNTVITKGVGIPMKVEASPKKIIEDVKPK